MATAKTVSKKRKFVADGVFRAELNEFFVRELVSMARQRKKKKKKKKIIFFSQQNACRPRMDMLA
jgi:hypothetical protein